MVFWLTELIGKREPVGPLAYRKRLIEFYIEQAIITDRSIDVEDLVLQKGILRKISISK